MNKALWIRSILVVGSIVFMVNMTPHADMPRSIGVGMGISLLWTLWCLRGAGARWGFRLGLLWGLLAYGMSLRWLWEIFKFPSLGLYLLLGSFVGIFGAWLGAATREDPLTMPFRPPGPDEKRAGFWFGPLVAVMWTGIEYYRCEWFWLRFPWITPGTSLQPTVLTPYIGAYGMSFLLILGLAWLMIRGWKASLAGVGVLAVVAWSIVVPPAPVTIPAGGGVKVGLVQCEAGYFAAYRELTESIDEEVDAIVWPEYALGYDIRQDPKDMERVQTILAATGARTLTLGSRTDREDGKWHNTAITLGEDGVLGTHDKNRPVHFFEDGEPGEVLESFETPLGRIATPVCFDCDYTAVARRLVSHGAEMILAPSMDAEHWTGRQHEQHAMLFRHRAAETGRWIAVAATSGVTQIIDPGGTVVDRLPTMTEDVLIGQVGRSNHTTFYVRIGWVLGPACAIIAGLVLLWTLGSFWRRTRAA